MKYASRCVRYALALCAVLGGSAATSTAQAEEAKTRMDSVQQLEQQVFAIGRKLRCPVCTAESVANSSVQIAVEMRWTIQQQLEQGQGEQEILAFFQSRYGDWILLDPPKRGLNLMLWILPPVAALLGCGFLVFSFRRWRTVAETPIEIDEGNLARVRKSLEEARR
jgi:cytochrome c-type biogenesis protein CcmH